MSGDPLAFTGLRVVESVYLTESERATVRRTWRQRLWSWPWRPWVSTTVITIQVPKKEALRIGNVLYMHPVTAQQLRAHLQRSADRTSSR